MGCGNGGRLGRRQTGRRAMFTLGRSVGLPVKRHTGEPGHTRVNVNVCLCVISDTHTGHTDRRTSQPTQPLCSDYVLVVPKSAVRASFEAILEGFSRRRSRCGNK